MKNEKLAASTINWVLVVLHHVVGKVILTLLCVCAAGYIGVPHSYEVPFSLLKDGGRSFAAVGVLLLIIPIWEEWGEIK